MTTAALLRTFVAMSSMATFAAAQTPPTQTKPDGNAVEIVEVLGCLGQTPDNAWILTNGTAPVVAKTIYTTKDTLKEAGEKPLGSERYRLLGVTPFNPGMHKGHKMAIRGALVKDPKETRINVTSLQMLGAACPK